MVRKRFGRGSARRSPVEWGGRVLLAAAGAWLGYGTVNHSLAQALSGSSPERAHKLAPDNGLVAAAFSSKLSGPDATTQDRMRADILARAALRRDPISVSALSSLGLNAQVRGDTIAARRTFAYAQQLTRRDLRTQLWAIEDAVARNDIPAALDQYDLALRTRRVAPDLLFPVLTGAIAEPMVRQELMRMLATSPPWGGDFVIYASAASSDPQATIALLDDMRQARIPIPASASARVIDALLVRGDATGAWRQYASLHPAAGRQASRDARFTGRGGAGTRFDWSPVEDAAVTATLEPSAKGGRFDFTTSPGAGGAVLRQMQVLPPGDYVIEGVASVEQTDAPPPYWLLSCADGQELGRVDVKPGGSRFTGTVRVLSGCPIQALTLVVRPSERMTSVAGQVTEARIHEILPGS